MPADDQHSIDSFDSWIRGTLNTQVVPRVAEMRADGGFTPEGITRQVVPMLQPGLEKFEAETRRRLDQLNATRGRIERGEQVPDGKGGWTTVRPPEQTPVSEVRAGEIRAYANQLSTSDLHGLIRTAYSSSDAETLHALANAPLAMKEKLWPATMRRELAYDRLAASRWQPEFDAAIDVLATRQQLAEWARGLLARISDIDTSITYERSVHRGGQVVISAADAKDVTKYRAAKARADRAGAQLVMSD